MAKHVLNETAHDRGLDATTLRVDALDRPSKHLLRMSGQLSQALSPDWSVPNVAVRIKLGAAHDDLTRVYTIRDFDAETSRVSIDIVIHDEPSPMMRWVAERRLGDVVELIGPRPHFAVPTSPGRAVIFADATAIPALYSLLTHWPTGRTAVGWVATEDETAFAELPAVDGVELCRLAPEPEAADSGDSVGPLARQALSLADPTNHVVWAAGERDEMKVIRSHFRSAGLPKDDVAVFGYWKRGVSTTVIDSRRRENYEEILAAGGTLADIDDLAIAI